MKSLLKILMAVTKMMGIGVQFEFAFMIKRAIPSLFCHHSNLLLSRPGPHYKKGIADDNPTTLQLLGDLSG
jgi:hypothetical protein